MVDALTKAGFQVTITDDFNQTAGTLKPYQAVFTTQRCTIDGAKVTEYQPLNNKELIAYHRGGGNVYLAGGVGPAGQPLEENNWKEFLGSIGLAFDGHADKIPAVVNSDHPIFQGIKELRADGSSVIVNLRNNDPRNQILVTVNGKGIFAIHDPSAGKELLKGIRQRD